MSIKDCIFITESFAHYNGREKGCSPCIDAARAEHEHLLQAKASHDQWLEKTDWVQEAIDTEELPAKYLSHHRADVMRMEIERLRAEHEALLKVARLASELTFCMNEDKDGGYFLCEEAAPVLNDLLDALEELK